MSWKIIYTSAAQKDSKKLAHSGLKKKALSLLEVLKEDLFTSPPHYKPLVGDLTGAFSRRINIQHRLVYQVYEKSKTIKVLRMWSHYE